MSYAHHQIGPAERLMSIVAATFVPAMLALLVMTLGIVTVKDGTPKVHLVSFDVPVQKTETPVPTPPRKVSSPHQKPDQNQDQVKPLATPTARQPAEPRRRGMAPVSLRQDAHHTLGHSDVGDIDTGLAGVNGRVGHANQSDAQSGASPTAGEDRQQEADQYGISIFRAVKAEQRYSAEMRRRGAEGTVVVAFTVNPRGLLRQERIARSSGVSMLDRSALNQLNAAAPFPRPPSGRARNFQMPLTYRPRD